VNAILIFYHHLKYLYFAASLKDLLSAFICNDSVL
jgi:hypothetical protein